MRKLGLNKVSSKRTGDMIMDRLIISLNNHKDIKNEKQKKTETLKKHFPSIMTCL